MKQHFHAFVVGSSLAVTVFPLAGLVIASRDKGLDALDWRLVFFIFPIVFGLTNLLTVGPLRRKTRSGFAVVGAVLGVALSNTGTFVFDIPRIVYGLEGDARYMALIVGPIFYALVWALVMYPIDRSLGIVQE